MCGINGIVAKISQDHARESIRAMNSTLAHRGPDADGIWQEENCTFGHRRLSIIDLSEASNQPMISSDGNYVIVYNGELYNYRELKFELQRSAQGQKSYLFRTLSDTEVVMAAFMRYGKDCLHKMNGMFAFAIYNRQSKEIFIARDRLGVKPLYYYYQDGNLAFSSELRALCKSKLFTPEINELALPDYVRYQTVHAPDTIVKNVSMLMPGHFIQLRSSEFNIQKWWNPEDFVPASPLKISYEEACSEIRKLFFEAVSCRLVSDVPFGAFLSGGIDSSAVVAAMANSGASQIKTFNIAFDESEFSEAVYARKIAQLYQTHHHEIILRPDEFLKDLPSALNALDHPGADGINTYIVSKATKNAGITMALSGLGGDELFAGYDVFRRMYSLRNRYWLNLIPRFARTTGANAYDWVKGNVASEKIATLLSKPAVNFDYAYPLSRQVFNEALVRGLTQQSDLPISKVYAFVRNQKSFHKNLFISRISIAEMNTYMQNILLRDADQMGMASALETRVPFLDYRLVEFCLSLPDQFKLGKGPKSLLVDALKNELPNEIVSRPKMGFVLPWDKWMRNELKAFCEDSINDLKADDFLNKEVMNNLWKRFIQNDSKITWSRMWGLVALCNWKKQNQIN